MKYDVLFSCGHYETIELFGSGKERELKLRWYKECGLCPECYKNQAEKRKKEAYFAASKNASLFGWPTLVGSKRQENWATILRQEFYDFWLSTHPRLETLKQVMFLIETVTDAAEWIDGRNDYTKFLWSHLKKHSVCTTSSVEITVEPLKRTHPGVVEICIIGYTVTASYLRNDDFYALVRKFEFSWNEKKRIWEREMTEQSGRTEDRAAEFGNALLLNGFAIKAENSYVREMAVSAKFKPECKRWILVENDGRYEGDLVIYCKRGDDEAWRAAELIAGAKWVSHHIVIPINEWQAVEEMARMKHFQISEHAQDAIDIYRKKITIVTPCAAPAPTMDSSPADILSSSREIIEDLKDDE